MQPSPFYSDLRYSEQATLVKILAGKIGGDVGGGIIGLCDIGLHGKNGAWITYDVIWPANMEWVKQGKLPGIGAGGVFGFNPPSVVPNGYNGSTVRPVWGAGGSAGLYVWDRNVTTYGRGQKTDGVFKAGQRQNVQVYMQLNTPGLSDGIAILKVDGVIVARLDDLNARQTDDMRLSLCYWCCFYGGGDVSYAPTKDQNIVISDVVIRQ